MLRTLLTGLSVLLLVLAPVPASALFFSPVVEDDLVVVDGHCYVRQYFADGRTHQYPCEWDDALDEFDDDYWDEFCVYARGRLTPEQYAKYCGLGPLRAQFYRLNEHLAFSDVRVNIDPGFTFTAPYQLGFLESNFGSGYETPALNLDVNTSGFKIGANIEYKLHWDRFMPIGGWAGFEFGQLHSTGSAQNVSFPGGLGAPNTGNGMNQGFLFGTTTLDSADLTIDRTFASLDKGMALPLGFGQFDIGNGIGTTIDWNTRLLLGLRGGFLSEHQLFTATSGAHNAQYDTNINGGFVGGYAGLGLGKGFDLPNSDLRVSEDFSLALGFSHYRLNIDDQLSGTNAGGSQNSSANYSVGATIPTLKLGTSIGVGNENFKVGVSGSVSTGTNPPIEIRRPVSSMLSLSDIILLSTLNYSLGLYLSIRPPPE